MSLIRTAPLSVIVDAYSTGNFLPPAFTKLGSELLHVQSTPQLMPSMLAPDLTAYSDNLVCVDADVTVKELERRGPLCVVAGQEPGVPLADLLSERLGVATNGSALSSARRNKFDMIQTLRAAGVRCARQHQSHDPEELARWADANGSYPYVVKPLSSASTDGVFICHDRDEVVRNAGQVVASSDIFGMPNAQALIQTFLHGTEYIVDTVSCDGRHYVCGVWQYEKSLVGQSKKIYDKDILLPSSESPVPELVSYVDTVLEALNLRYGPAHAEVIMTPDGPALVEIGARLNGNMNPGFHDICLGANQADLTALAYIRPDEFLRRFADRRYELRQPAIVYNVPTTVTGVVRAIDQSVVQDISQLESVYLLSVKLKPGGHIRRTVDLLSSPLRVFMTNGTYDAIMRDYRRIQELKDGVYVVE